MASFVVCVVALLCLYLVGLGVYTQVTVFITDLPTYTAKISGLMNNITIQLEKAEQTAQNLLIPHSLQQDDETPPAESGESDATTRWRRSAEPPAAVVPSIPEVRIRQERPSLVNVVYDYLSSFYEVILMASFVPFLVYFMLSWKDHVRLGYLQLFDDNDRQAASRSWTGMADMARAYVVGNFALGLLLAVVSGFFFWVINLPYFALIGPLSGFLSLIPLYRAASFHGPSIFCGSIGF